MNRAKCPLCGSHDVSVMEELSVSDLNKSYKKVFGISSALSAESLNYCRCNSCALQYFEPLETGGESLYETLQRFDWYYMPDKFEYGIARKILLAPEIERVLEVGSGMAAFASQVGADRYTGLEFNDKAISRAKAVGVNLLKQSIQDHAAEGHVYDAVVSFQVLEHVSDPAAFLKSCVHCLRPGGVMILAVPGRDGFGGRVINNLLDMPPHHVTHWSIESLLSVAKLFDLVVREMTYEPVADYHRRFFSKVVFENRLRKFFRLPARVLDSGFCAKIISGLAHARSAISHVDARGEKGHTVIAVYEKKGV